MYIQPRSELQFPTHVIPTLMHMPALLLVGSTLVAPAELINENIGIYIGPRFILIHIGDQAAKSSELLPYTSTCKAVRSEEHTSELQSPVPISYAVFCLKKKKHIHDKQYQTTTPENNTICARS